jgi:GST-like protein
VIDLYTSPTPNGWKVSMGLEEMGFEYETHIIDLSKGEQRTREFLQMNPNGRIPVIRDRTTGVTIFESGAILIYLARKCGRFLPSDPRDEIETLQWLMFQMGGIGPIFGQVHHFKRAAKEPVPYALERYGKECLRLYDVLDKRLGENDYVAAGAYTIADMAIFPWVARFEWQEVDLAAFPNVERWYRVIEQRPAVQRGLLIPPRP